MAKSDPSPKLEEALSQKERQIFSNLDDQDELLTVLARSTHAHFRSGEERSPPY